ncbi:hypothetical protein AB5J62_13650 [Amycolatopsis sp. cg5]|uniref:hypothetical protein n=1 Tax=Amycolatopsis sp. cg5 TaxID=3238802 RepID=UPI0035242921
MTDGRLAKVADPAEHLAWLSQDSTSTGWATGHDKSGWEDSAWTLHAMWKQASRSRQAAPPVINGINLDDVSVDTGVPLGYVPSPGEGATRLRWAELAGRMGFRLGEGQQVPPSRRWFPITSWPADVEPPSEGSLDETSLRALLRILARHSASTCYAYYASVPSGDWDEPTLFSGPLDAIPDLVGGPDAMAATPSNIWPADRSWFVYTDWDLWATRVSGSRELIAELGADPDLETVAVHRG